MHAARYGISDDAENRSGLGPHSAASRTWRTRDRPRRCTTTLTRLPGLHATPPLGHLDMLALPDRIERVLDGDRSAAAPATALGRPRRRARSGRAGRTRLANER